MHPVVATRITLPYGNGEPTAVTGLDKDLSDAVITGALTIRRATSIQANR
mgnify:CR=1 FL=1